MMVSRSLGELAGLMSQGAVKTLIVLCGNPVFTAPSELGFDKLLGRVEQVIRLGLHVDETSTTATTHVPAKHFLEAWGDNVAWDGTYLSQQPVIEPLYPSVSELELIAFLLAMQTDGFELVRATLGGASVSIGHTTSPSEANDAWRKFVHDGFSTSQGYPAAGVSNTSPGAAGKSEFPRPLNPDEYELTFYLGNLDDGRYANNGWLQELSDSVTKLTWDNALLVSPATATKLGVNVTPAQRQLGRSARHRLEPALDRRHTHRAHRHRPDDRVPDGQSHHARRPLARASRPRRARPA